MSAFLAQVMVPEDRDPQPPHPDLLSAVVDAETGFPEAIKAVLPEVLV